MPAAYRFDTPLLRRFGSITVPDQPGDRTMYSRFAKALFLCALFIGAGAVEAAVPFDAASFEKAQKAGHSVLVDVTAPWCPICAKQKPTIAALEAQHPDLVVFEVDFDTAHDTLRQFKVVQQSTLIMFKGASETARSVGQTQPEAIKTLVESGL